ncbi:MAG: low specificity L-threonine aldolase [Deltaproteobacteria bacterium]|nr:low specificity L-threonine aldolase [Deltaproteobacteria bacterium]
MKYFSSDNNSGAHPAVLEAVAAANQGNVASYGDDPYTREAENLVRHIFGRETRSYFIFTGTAANALILKAALRPWEGVICAETAHINTDECGAVEALGRKLYLVPQINGKITPAGCAGMLHYAGSVHNVAPKIVSITQSTEFGQLYTLEEVRALADFCRSHGLYLHMDGSRITNAAAALGIGLREASKDLGVDMLSMGGTKNGLLCGECAVFFNPAIAPDFPYFRKQGMQLGAKMRFVSAQFLAYLKNDLWRANAVQANSACALLAEKISSLPKIKITRPVEANALFARLPEKALQQLEKTHHVSVWNKTYDPLLTEIQGPEVRIMTSFNTTTREVEELAGAIEAALRS